MSSDPIAHLDEGGASTPFDVIVSLDATLTIFRQALAEILSNTLTYDAVRSSEESDLMAAGSLLWSARESLIASVETDV